MEKAKDRLLKWQELYQWMAAVSEFKSTLNVPSIELEIVAWEEKVVVLAELLSSECEFPTRREMRDMNIAQIPGFPVKDDVRYTYSPYTDERYRRYERWYDSRYVRIRNRLYTRLQQYMVQSWYLQDLQRLHQTLQERTQMQLDTIVQHTEAYGAATRLSDIMTAW